MLELPLRDGFAQGLIVGSKLRRIRYCCAISLDGYIAGSGDEFDWIVMDPEIDFGKLSAQFDTWLLGRRTFEVTGAQSSPGSRTFVFSRTLHQSDHPNVSIVGENWKEVVQSLREEPGKDIWLFGGGSLFHSLAAEGFVDTVEVAVMPTILGGGIPLVAEPSDPIPLTLIERRTYEKTGTVMLVYAVKNTRPREAGRP